MPLKNTKEAYGAVAKFFHWATAFIILGLIIVGLYMVNIPYSPFKLEVYAYHKSFGLLVLWLVGLRLIWRSFNKKPQAHGNHKKWETLLAKLVHIFLYVAMIAMPLSGWLMSSAGQYPIPFFGFQMTDLMGADQGAAKRMGDVHQYLAYALILVISLHAAGALKHHFIDKDTTLKRMLAWPLRAAGPVILTILMLAFAYGVVALGIYPKINSSTENLVNDPVVKQQEAQPISSKEAYSWNIVKNQSYIRFKAKVYGKEFIGSFNDFTGEIIFDPESLKDSQVNIKIDLTTIDSQDAERDSQMQTEAWFNVEKHPNAFFTARTFNKTDQGYIAQGTLKIKDKAVPINLPFQLEINNAGRTDQAKMVSTIELNRLDFDLGTGQWETSDTVSQQVTVDIQITAIKDIE